MTHSSIGIWRKRSRRFSERGFKGLGRSLAQAEWQAAADLWRTIEKDIDGWVVDLGVGSGGFWSLVQRPPQLIGLDLVVLPLVITPRPLILRADAARLPFQDNVLSGLVALGLVEYLSDLPSVFREWRHVVKRGGHLLLTNSPPILPNIARRIFGFGAHPRPDSTIITDLEQSGWKISKTSPRRGWQSAFLAQAV
ncbi:MAG: class I SAM-dependent methyltransferase [Calditrichota bacterium]